MSQNNQITSHVGRARSNARYQLAGNACAVASKHAHTYSIGRGGSAPPLSEFSEKRFGSLSDQGYGRGGILIFTGGVFEPLARVALYPTDEDGLDTWYGAA